MFENIVVRAIPGQGADLDIGALAEIILYYGSTHLIIDYGKLCNLLRCLGEENIDFLITEGFIKITYSMSQTAVRTNKFGPLQTHDFASFQFGGSVPKKPTAENQIGQAYKRAGRKPDKSVLFQKRLLRHSAIVSDFDKLSRQNLASFAMESIQDPVFLRSSVRSALSRLVPNIKIPDNFRFIPIKDKNGFIIDTDLDIELMNREYHKVFSPDHSSLSQAYLLSFILESIIDTALAAHYGSEILTSTISSEIVELRMASLFAKLRRDRSEIQSFSNFVFEESNSIRESINSGLRSFDGFRSILLKSREFRSWIDGVNPDKNLL